MARIKATEHYPIKDDEREHAETLKAKHGKASSRMRLFDQGRVHAAIYITSMLKHNGHKEAAGEVEKFLNWMTDHKPEQARLNVQNILTGSKGTRGK